MRICSAGVWLKSHACVLAWCAFHLAENGAATVPVHPPGPLSFYDQDGGGGEIGGVFEFIKASSEADITHYVTYFGSSPTSRTFPLVNLSANGFDPQYTIPINTPIPVVDGVAASHLITFSANADGEGTEGVSLAFHDRAVPVHAPAAVSFADADYLHGSIGGRATVLRAADESDVTAYTLYFGTGPSSLLVSASSLLSIPAGIGPLVHEFPNGTAIPAGATHLLAFTANDDGISETAAAAELHDHALPDQPAVSVEFHDNDLARGEISGLVTIVRASSEALVDSYAIYFAHGPSGPLDMLLGVEAATGADVTHLIPADTILAPGISHLIVYTRNSDGQMATGVHTLIVDRAIPIHQAAGIEFDDTDTAINALAGTITVMSAADESDITYYSIFFADDGMQPLSSTPIAALSQGPLQLNHTLDEGTAPPTGASRLLVLSGNDDGLMAMGASVPLVDRAVPLHPPLGLQFADLDVDAGELGGTLTVLRASDEVDVTSYAAYYGSSASADLASVHSAIGAADVSGLPGSTVVFTIFLNTPLPAGATHFLVFSRNQDGTMPTGVSMPILDVTGTLPTVAVTGMSFIDYDLNLGLIGGPLAWTEPSDTLGLTGYTVFLSVDEAGTLKQQFGDAIAVTAPNSHRVVTVPTATGLSTLLGQAGYIIIYATNSQGRGPGSALEIVDRAAPVDAVVSLTFADVDPANGKIGGVVEWVPPSNPDGKTHFTAFTVYFAKDAAGMARVQHGEVLLGINALAISPGTQLQDFTHLVVHTKNDDGEAVSSLATVIVDRVLPSVIVDELVFLDQDLGTGELGGKVSWNEPADRTWVERYAIYLDEVGGARQHLGEVPVGYTSFVVPFNTPLANFSNVTVVAANAVGEALVYASLPITDRTVQSCPSSFGHTIKSSRWRILAGPVAGLWRVRSIRFYEDALCTRRLPTLPAGWPRRPRQAAGSPFATPPSVKNLDNIFLADTGGGSTWANGSMVQEGVDRPWWLAAGPCTAPVNATEGGAMVGTPCSIGFSWESTTAVSSRGRVRGSGGTVQESKKAVQCVEVEQSDTAGEYATSLSLQWFDEHSKQYRTLLWRPVGHGMAQLAHQQVLAAECYELTS